MHYAESDALARAWKVITFNSVISSCEKGKQWNYALGVLGLLHSKHVESTEARQRRVCRERDAGAFSTCTGRIAGYQLQFGRQRMRSLRLLENGFVASA